MPHELLSVLMPGSAFGWVTELARRPVCPCEPPLDLSLRSLPKPNPDHHATLYVGTTQVLGIHLNLHLNRQPGFKLSPHKKGGLFRKVDPPFKSAWSRYQPIEDLRDHISAIRAYVEAAITAAPDERQSEGFYQAALTKENDLGFTMVDREVSPAYVEDAGKRSVKQAFQEQARGIIDCLGAKQEWWAAGWNPPGDKVDGLAIDTRGKARHCLHQRIRQGPSPSCNVRVVGHEMDRR
ncbi:MAG: hypothetical protein H0T19_04140 [Thermoleophilaceae bacterium]|nr:hypothetical protein [Thermoleophilaceae bacterium]